MSNQWYVQQESGVIGPITSRQLKQLAANTSVTKNTPVRLGNSNSWVTAGKVKGLFSATDDIDENSGLPAESTEITGWQTGVSTLVSEVPPSQRTCPFCAERIAVAAIKCRHCGEFLNRQPVTNIEQNRTPVVAKGSNEIHNYLLAGYAMAAFMPLIGGIIGIIVLTKNHVGHGIAIIVFALFMFSFWLAFLEAF